MDRSLPSFGSRGEGWVALQLALAGAIGVVGVSRGDAWSGPSRWVTNVAGATLLAAGIVGAAAGAVGLGGALSPFPRPRTGGALVESGIYARIRHPIYASLAAGAIGWGLLEASPPALGLALVLAVVLDLKARREEAWLAETYPGYAAYRARTRRLIPGLY